MHLAGRRMSLQSCPSPSATAPNIPAHLAQAPSSPAQPSCSPALMWVNVTLHMRAHLCLRLPRDEGGVAWSGIRGTIVLPPPAIVFCGRQGQEHPWESGK